jgi:hypothetical protein
MADTLQEEIERLNSELSFYKANGPVALFYELNRFVNGTVALMRKNSLESLLKVEKDEDPKKFERMMALIKNAKEHTSDMEEMKTKLGLTGDEAKDKEKIPFIETIARDRK